MMDKLTFSVQEAAKATGLCTKSIYELIKSDRGFPAITVGRRILIPVEALNRWLNQQASQ